MTAPMIDVRGVRKRFGDVTALDGVDLQVPRGAVLGLLGPNGAGKTTLVRVLATLLRPDEGSATVAGLDVARDTMALRAVIGLAGQYAAVEPDMTGRENLVMVGRLYHLTTPEARRRADAVLERINLTEAADRPVKTYSGGMRRRLDLAASLVGRPAVLFMDEPTTGLDPRSRMELWGLIQELVHDGTTLLLTTQYLDEADVLADSIAVIDHGRLIAEGTADELKDRTGGDVLQLTVGDRSRTVEAADLLADLGHEAPRSDAFTGDVHVATGLGAQALVQAVRRLDEAGIEVADLALRRPTLDEVFLSLTGAPTESLGGGGDAETPRRGRRGRARAGAGRTA
jgi:ABC-2 type transport system ATP-binding protein